jgi:hypothetical protein
VAAGNLTPISLVLQTSVNVQLLELCDQTIGGHPQFGDEALGRQGTRPPLSSLIVPMFYYCVVVKRVMAIFCK